MSIIEYYKVLNNYKILEWIVYLQVNKQSYQN